MSPECLLFLP